MRTLVLLLWWGLLAVPVRAHPLAPSLFEIQEQDDGRATVRWKRPLTAPAATLQPLLPDRCHTLGPVALQVDDDARVFEVPIACDGGLVGLRFGVIGLATSRTDVLLRIAFRDGRVVHRVLRPGADTFVVPHRPGPLAIALEYGRLGLEHIAGGYDHLLFLLGLCALAGGWRRLAGMVTAFTAGHGLTLSAAVVGGALPPAAPLEVLIAATIVMLAAELARPPAAAPTLLRRRPWLLTFGFGLLHGLGFAGALSETGMPDGEVVAALLGFNVGIEAGQMMFVAAVAALGLALTGRIELAPRRRTALAYVIGGVAACLVVERSVLLLPAATSHPGRGQPASPPSVERAIASRQGQGGGTP